MEAKQCVKTAAATPTRTATPTAIRTGTKAATESNPGYVPSAVGQGGPSDVDAAG